MVQYDERLFAREDVNILRVFSADRKTADTGQHTGLLVNTKDSDGVFAGGGSIEIPAAWSELHTAAGAAECLRITQSRNLLNFFEFRCLSGAVVLVDDDFVGELTVDVGKMSVMAEGEEPWAGVELAAQNIEEMNPAAPLIDLIDFDLVNAVIDCAQIFVVRSRDDAAHMRTEVPLCDTAESLVEDTVHD